MAERESRQDMDAQRAFERAALALRAQRQILHLLHQFAAVAVVQFARFRKLDRARGAMEQRHAKMLFELLDARGDDGFRDADLARRVGEALRLRHAHERLDTQYQVHPPFLLKMIWRL